ncbi:hypothetical protein Tco_0180507 [Tanacetum coccineum]
MAYKLELPDKLRGIHSTFHVSNLKKCLADENLVIPLEEIQLDDKLHFIEEPVEIMDREVKQLKQSRIPIVKVRWNSRRGPEYTWEREDFFKRNYPHLFSSNQKTRKRNRAPGRRSHIMDKPTSPICCRSSQRQSEIQTPSLWFMAVAPTPDLIMSRRRRMLLFGTITRVPYYVRPFSGTFYVGSGSSRQVFVPGPTGRDVNTLHRKGQHALRRSVCTLEDQIRELVQGDREENKKLKTMLESTQRDFDRLSWHHHNLRQWSFEVQWHLHPFRHYRERPYVAPTAPVAPIARADPDDPSARPTRRPRRDDPYVMVRDAAARDEGDDAATTSDPQPIMPPKRRTQTNPQPTLTREAADQLVPEGIEVALRVERERVRMEATRAGGPARCPAAAPVAQECSFMGFMKCGPTQFHGNECAVELCRWFEKIESVFGISECAERSKVKFAVATLQGRALTWWNSQVATLGLDVVNGKSWTDMRKMMKNFVQMKRFKGWKMTVPMEKKKVELYIKGLPENIKGETTSSRPTVLNEAVRMAHTPMEQKLQAKAERITESNKRKWESNNNQGGNNNNQGGNNNNNQRNYRNNNRHNQSNNQRHRNARALTTTQNARANQTGVASKCNRCGLCHFDQCPPRCNNCGKIGHKDKDYRSKNVVSGINA